MLQKQKQNDPEIWVKVTSIIFLLSRQVCSCIGWPRNNVTLTSKKTCEGQNEVLLFTCGVMRQNFDGLEHGTQGRDFKYM